MPPAGGRRRGPYPKLPAGEVEGRASESRGEKLSHLLSASGRRGRRLAAAAGPGERPPEVQLSHPSMTLSEYQLQLSRRAGHLPRFHTAEAFPHPLSGLFQGQCASVSSINDRNDWKTVKNALQIINIDEINAKVSHKQALHRFGLWLTGCSSWAGAVWGGRKRSSPGECSLRLGQHRPGRPQQQCRAALGLKREKENKVAPRFQAVFCLARLFPLQLLGVDAHSLQEGLTYRKIEARTDQVCSGSNALWFREICL